MKRNHNHVSLAMLALAGTTTTLAHAQHPVTLDPAVRPVNPGGHIYYNAVSGERIVTLLQNNAEAARLHWACQLAGIAIDLCGAGEVSSSSPNRHMP